MLLKKMAGKNYFIALIILLGIAALLVVSAFILTAFVPEALGRNVYNYELISIYEFEPWSFEAGSLEISFPQGGIIVTLSETERKRSLLLLGDGAYRLNGASLAPETVGGIFVVLDDALFEDARGSIIFNPVEEMAQAEAAVIAALQPGIPPIWAETIPLVFHAEQGLVFHYFVTEQGEPIFPPYVHFTNLSLFGSFAIYTLFILIMLLTIYIFSLEHRYSRYWEHLAKTRPGAFSLILAPLLAGLVMIGEIAPYHFGWPDYYLGFGYALALVILAVSAKSGKVDYLDLGLRRDRLKHGYLLAIIAAAMIIGSTRGLPAEISFSGVEDLVCFARVFFLIALPRELIWRGYIQAVLSRRFGATTGILGMIVLVAAAHYGILAYTVPWMTDYPYAYLETLVLVPGIAAILGYLYLRTENIFACVLLHSMVVFLPGYILY